MTLNSLETTLKRTQSNVNKERERVESKASKIKQKEIELDTIRTDLVRQCEAHQSSKHDFEKEKLSFEKSLSDYLVKKKELAALQASLDGREECLNKSEAEIKKREDNFTNHVMLFSLFVLKNISVLRSCMCDIYYSVQRLEKIWKRIIINGSMNKQSMKD